MENVDTAAQPALFPSDWRSAVVLVPHPDDPEYFSAAVAKWTSSGRLVRYVLASSGEAGIANMPAAEAGPLREREQRRAAALVGVDDVEFWDEPDSNIRNTPALRAKIVELLTAAAPDVVVTVDGADEMAPGMPNQRDHMEFAAAVVGAHDSMADPPPWLFASALQAITHVEIVDEFFDTAVAALAAHSRYLAVLDPDTPVEEQARGQLETAVPRRHDVDGHRVSQFVQLRGR